MNELYKLKEYFKMYVDCRDKEQRELIKKAAITILENIYGNNTEIESIEFDRIRWNIKYTIKEYYTKSEQHRFAWSEATKKYYFDNLTFSY
jgi:hypothetical protein